MSRKIVVGSICCGPLTVESNPSYDEAVERMIDFWEDKLEGVLADSPDIIVLPEKCDRPTNFVARNTIEYFMSRGEKILEFFKEKARENNCYIAYPSARQLPDKTWRNSVWLIGRKGEIAGIYDKNYPTIGETAEQHILPGSTVPVFECDFGRVACGICFDILFEEHKRNYTAFNQDIILFSSMMHGGILANYWAYSSRSYIIGAIGGLRSYVISPLGKTIAENGNYHEFLTCEINLDYKVAFLDDNRHKFKAAKEKYGRKIKIEDPGWQGSFLITSESEELSVDEVIREFDIELLDDYISRSSKYRDKSLEL